MNDSYAIELIEAVVSVTSQLKEMAGELRAVREELQEMRLIQHRAAQIPVEPSKQEVTEVKNVGPQAYVELPLKQKVGQTHGGL